MRIGGWSAANGKVYMGSLWEQAKSRSQEALASGKLIHLKTQESILEEAGVRFLLRLARNLARKAQQPEQGKPENPFLPYDSDLFVADASATHAVLLNKYNVLDQHLLVVTRRFESQESVLTEADFAALCLCLAEKESLGFYNGGPDAGASQAHKHLQVVPLPFSAQTEPLPISPLWERPQALPFRYAQQRVPRVPDSRVWALEVHRAYQRLLGELGLTELPDGRISVPYNLLVTWDRILVVPRSRERFHTVSVNALGFVGSFFVKTEEEAALVRRTGPLQVLREVSQPKS